MVNIGVINKIVVNKIVVTKTEAVTVKVIHGCSLVNLDLSLLNIQKATRQLFVSISQLRTYIQQVISAL